MLRFVPLGAQLVPTPGVRTHHGEQPRRVCARVRGDSWKIADKPWQCAEKTRDATLAMRLASRGSLLPYDEHTAAVCGVRYRPVRWVDAERGWTTEPPPKSPAPPKRAAASSKLKD
jgi:hypothetical protein